MVLVFYRSEMCTSGLTCSKVAKQRVDDEERMIDRSGRPSTSKTEGSEHIRAQILDKNRATLE
jgi:hypothetical protein